MCIDGLDSSVFFPEFFSTYTKELFSIENKISVEKSTANFLSLNLSLYAIRAQHKQMIKNK